VEQRVQFVATWRSGDASTASLCRTFGISRPTGYKWLARYFEDYEQGDVRALEDRPRRPIHRPQTLDPRLTGRRRSRSLSPPAPSPTTSGASTSKAISGCPRTTAAIR
jgi:transposase-like protein